MRPLLLCAVVLLDAASAGGVSGCCWRRLPLLLLQVAPSPRPLVLAGPAVWLPLVALRTVSLALLAILSLLGAVMLPPLSSLLPLFVVTLLLRVDLTLLLWPLAKLPSSVPVWAGYVPSFWPVVLHC
jgi:hypothetical protein